VLGIKFVKYRKLNWNKGVPVMLKVQEIRELIKLIDESTIDEFKYESNGTTVKLKKNSQVSGEVTQVVTQPAPQAAVSQSAPTPQPVQPSNQVETDSTKSEDAEAPKETTAFDHEIVSPMVGTFYRSPSPDSDAYVEVGAKVKNDSTVCIVEAMKLFNEIEAEVTGEIVEILVADGELVEYGQPLFRVKK
jgi:acetyl-CoA carboxylase biotin carboxyl carrier protein